MKNDSDYYDLHVLVCTNTRASGASCGPQGAEEILQQLKQWSKKAGFKGRVRVNKSGCLNRCEHGVVCVAYPQAEWVIEARPEDVPALQDWMKSLDVKD